MSKKGKANKIDKHVGALIKSIRESNDLNQTAVAHHLGVTFQQIQKYERGDNRISAGNLYKLSKLFCVDINEFYRGLDD